MKRKAFVLALVLMLVISTLSGCGNAPTQSSSQSPTPTAETVDSIEITLSLTTWNESRTEAVDIERTGTYTGQMLNGLPEGTGKFETVASTGESWYYEGEFKDGKFNGQGECVWPANGYTEKGTYLNGQYTPSKIDLFEFASRADMAKFSLSNTSKDFIESNINMFPAVDEDGLEAIKELCDTTIEYKHLLKSMTPYLETFYHDTNRILQIVEFTRWGQTLTAMTCFDSNGHFSRLIYGGALPDVFQDDIVEFYGLPVDLSSYENVGGGTTNVAVFIAGSIEKVS